MGGSSGSGDDHWNQRRAFHAVAQVKADLSAQQQFHDAISRQNDADFLRLLTHPEVNVNANRARAMWLAAEKKNYYYMRELVMAGADLFFARQEAYEELDAKFRARNGLSKKDPDYAEACEQHERYERTWRVIYDYALDFAKEIAPIEAARAQQRAADLQQKTLDAIESLKNDMQQMNNGQALPKPVLRNLPRPGGQG